MDGVKEEGSGGGVEWVVVEPRFVPLAVLISFPTAIIILPEPSRAAGLPLCLCAVYYSTVYTWDLHPGTSQGPKDGHDGMRGASGGRA